jgi:UDP-2,3-diacylglucosamine pyrophosphatase LpxH
MDERIVIVLSDLHVGGGSVDPGDDHIYDKQQLAEFIWHQAQSPEGRLGRIELIFNGDFLEFAQTNVDAFELMSDDCWCQESESLAKLETILYGHPEIFRALRDFQDAGNAVTIAAGNHDVDLYWPAVQERLRQVAGDGLNFAIGQDWLERFEGKLQIGHGHMDDPANRFENWSRPIVTTPWGIETLEMCPGTLFMVKFVNHLEARYPFADNLLPVTKLGAVLFRDNKAGFASVGWMAMRLLGTTSWVTLGSEGTGEDYGSLLLRRVNASRRRVTKIAAALRKLGMESDAEIVEAHAITAQRLAELMLALLGRIDLEDWREMFELGSQEVVLGDDAVTLQTIVGARKYDGKAELRKVAQQRSQTTGATVVVMGHTHQVDEFEWTGGKYYNPGCWTRYLELEGGKAVTLKDLEDESNYPYALNAVRIERQGDKLLSGMLSIERFDPVHP